VVKSIITDPLIQLKNRCYPPGNMLSYIKNDHFISRTGNILTFFPDRESKMGFYPDYPNGKDPPLVIYSRNIPMAEKRIVCFQSKKVKI